MNVIAKQKVFEKKQIEIHNSYYFPKLTCEKKLTLCPRKAKMLATGTGLAKMNKISTLYTSPYKQ